MIAIIPREADLIDNFKPNISISADTLILERIKLNYKTLVIKINSYKTIEIFFTLYIKKDLKLEYTGKSKGIIYLILNSITRVFITY